MMMRKLYKKLSATAVMLLMLASVVLAQDRTVSGTVSDGSGSAMPGVNVVIKGTSNGTTTDASGKYSISAGSDAVLVFSFIGYASQQVSAGNRTTVDVNLAEDAQQLSEVVVTALGIQRDKKALQYSVTSIKGDNFTQARENNLGNSLAGRVAGVNVTKVSSGPAGSSRVVIRGAKSLGGNNQPLYVIDGIPMDNSNFGQAGVWGGSDEGDGLSSINPDDIESITVLKGGNAAALYGSRAANGVINVVTKKGSASKGLGIEFNSNYVLETVNDLRDIQTSYGGGGMVGATLDTRVATKASTFSQLGDAFNGGWNTVGWGPKYDGSNVVQFDGVTRKYNYAGNNWDRFYNTGKSFTNSIAFTGGSDKQNFRFGVSNLNSTGIVPNSGYDRLNMSLAVNSKFGEKLTLAAKVIYSHEDVLNRPNVSDSPGSAVQTMWRMAGDVNVEDLMGDPNKLGAVPSLADQAAGGITIYDGKKPGEEMQLSSNLWGQNPYWAAHQFRNSDKRDRLITSGQLRYDFTDFLYVQGRAGLDSYTRRSTGLTPQGTGFNRGGNMSEGENRTMEYNLEYTVGFNKAFGDFNVNAFFGGNKMYRSSESISADGNGFNVEFFPAINNARDRNFGYGFSEQGINSVFGSAEVSYKNYLFLTGTMRQDWFSVLNPDVNNILYPSVGASFVFSDAFELPSVISFGKVRASYAQVGSATIGPYSTLNTYSLGNPHLGRPMATFSSAGGFSGNLPNPALQPAVMSEIEFGFDLRLFQNRLAVDFTYYTQTTTDDILNANISRASGFGSSSVNLGEMSNKGVEVLLSGTPVKKGDFTWDVSLNFAKNNNEVVSLIEGNNELIVEEPRTRTVFVKHIVGQPFGVLTGLKQLTSPAGQLVYNATTGEPIQTPTYQFLGNGVPDFTGGLNNEFSYKGINLSFLIDFKAGGDIYSGTNVRLTSGGFHQQTLTGRVGEAPLVRTGVSDADGNGVYEPFTKTYSPGAAANYWGQLSNRAQENFIYDASFAKLRQLTLGYSLPKSLLSKTAIKNATISFVGRNLAILFKNTDNIDPESSYSSSNGQGLDYFGVPATRSYGFNLKLVF